MLVFYANTISLFYLVHSHRLEGNPAFTTRFNTNEAQRINLLCSEVTTRFNIKTCFHFASRVHCPQ